MKVIKSKNLPAKLPMQSTVLWYLVIDYFNAPDWVLGAYAAIYLLVWIACIIALAKQEEIDLFDALGDISDPVKNSKFLQKLKEAMSKAKEN